MDEIPPASSSGPTTDDGAGQTRRLTDVPPISLVDAPLDSASATFVAKFVAQIDNNKIDNVIDVQKHTLCRYEKTNEMLANCNTLCGARFDNIQKDLANSSSIILEMKKDLDSIFRRIRLFKQKVAQSYPEEHQAASARVLARNRSQSGCQSESECDESEAATTEAVKAGDSANNNSDAAKAPPKKVNFEDNNKN